ncbi:MAG: hypothetical protein DWQ08_00085, partial [Proteobacteria bacterium]
IIASGEVHALREQTARTVFGVSGALIALLSSSNEYAARHFKERLEAVSRQFGADMENKSPEEMGQALGEFLKGLENAAQQEQQPQ